MTKTVLGVAVAQSMGTWPGNWRVAKMPLSKAPNPESLQVLFVHIDKAICMHVSFL